MTGSSRQKDPFSLLTAEPSLQLQYTESNSPLQSYYLTRGERAAGRFQERRWKQLLCCVCFCAQIIYTELSIGTKQLPPHTRWQQLGEAQTSWNGFFGDIKKLWQHYMFHSCRLEKVKNFPLAHK